MSFEATQIELLDGVETIRSQQEQLHTILSAMPLSEVQALFVDLYSHLRVAETSSIKETFTNTYHFVGDYIRTAHDPTAIREAQQAAWETGVVY